MPVEPVQVEGPLELIGGRWLLRIPLDVGGRQLISLTEGIATIVGETLEIQLPENLVRNLSLKEGQHVWVTSNGAEFSFDWEPEVSKAPVGLFLRLRLMLLRRRTKPRDADT